MRSRNLPLPAAALLALGLAGCPGSIDDPARFLDGGGGEVTCDPPLDVEGDLFAVRCSGSVCHSAPDPAEGLDLVTAGAAERMRGAASAGCPPRVLFDPANPAASYLLEKLEDAPSCGDRMPIATAPLSPVEKACVLEYLQGAAAGGSL